MRIILAIVFLGLFLSMNGQTPLDPEWVRIQSSELPSGNAEAWAVGTTDEGDVIWGVNKDAGGWLQFMNAFVYRLNPQGEDIWLDTAYTGVGAQQSYNLKVTDSLVFVGGRTCSTAGTENCDALFLTTQTSDGQTQNAVEYNGPYGYEEIDGIHLEEDGVILTGWSAGENTAIDVLLLKLDYEGNFLWANTWGHPGERDDHQDGHIVVDDEYIFVAGLHDGSVGLGWDGKSLLAKFDKTNGEFVDSLTFGRDDTWFNAENALGMTSDGTYLYVTGYTTPSPNNWDMFIAKFDKDFNEIWYETWGYEEDAETARAIAVAPDGSIYVGANTNSIGSGGLDMALLRYSPDGELLSEELWGDTLDDHTLDIHIRNDVLYMTGKTTSFHPEEKWEAVLIKVQLENTESVDDQGEKDDAYIFPNPSNDIVYLPKSCPVQVFDLNGRVLLKASTDKLNVSSLAEGTYVIQFDSRRQLLKIGN